MPKRSTAAALRKFADMIDRGVPEDEIGPLLWLLGRTMSKRAKPRRLE